MRFAQPRGRYASNFFRSVFVVRSDDAGEVRASFAQMVSKTVLSRIHARNGPAIQARNEPIFSPAAGGLQVRLPNCQSIPAWGNLEPQIKPRRQ